MRSLLPLIAAAILLNSCGYDSPVEPYATTKSHFINAPKVDTSKYPPEQLFRVYERAASGFVTVAALRSSATEIAQNYCDKHNCKLEILGEKRTVKFPLPGNFPAIELVFAAVPLSATQTADNARLARLKQMHDSGLMSEAEFEREKARYLNGTY